MAGVDMTKPTTRKKRSKLTVALLAPILIIVFIVGWSLYWIGQSRQPNTKQPQKTINKTPAKQDNVKLIVIPQQEEQILAS
jgi:Tfp pilus assembly protein PilO